MQRTSGSRGIAQPNEPSGKSLRPKSARKVLEVERRDDKRVRRKSRRLDDWINLGLASKVGNVELAAADCFYIRQRGPNEMFDAGILGGVHRRCCLLKLVGAFSLKLVTRKTPCAPSNAALRVSGRFKSASMNSAVIRDACLGHGFERAR